ncbi:hypothetical protein RSAG8_08694, partial [Rhizoctonia solani AG-8 WAC10335]
MMLTCDWTSVSLPRSCHSTASHRVCIIWSLGLTSGKVNGSGANSDADECAAAASKPSTTPSVLPWL